MQYQCYQGLHLLIVVCCYGYARYLSIVQSIRYYVKQIQRTRSLNVKCTVWSRAGIHVMHVLACIVNMRTACYVLFLIHFLCKQYTIT